ncbi:MAG TPA: hypothetical protein VFA96_03130, partial [Nocardioides sp.]|nr:hypothetical protein [Nocardioides sp.]
LLETALDLVQADSKAQRRRISWRILGDTVGSIVRVLRTPEPPPLPEWLEPPDNACRAVPTIPFRWSAISLDPDADQLLRRVVEAVPSPLADGVHLDAWLRGDTGTSGDPDVTTVHLGAEAIGTIEPADLDLYRGALNDAAKDDEHPLLPARITPLRHGGWLVCLQVPE